MLSQNSSSQNDTFATSVVKEIKNESNLVELEVPDQVAGAILGPKAKTLVEIQRRSGCKVEVHKRGETASVTEGYRLIRSFFALSCLVVKSVFLQWSWWKFRLLSTPSLAISK